MQRLEDRPPYVQFETRSIEDREASIAAGHYVGRDVDFAIITPSGSKDRIERICAEWFPQLQDQLAQERISASWVQAYKDAYKAYQEGKEPPVNGTPVLNWPGLSPSTVKQLTSLGLRAVEDVASMNEETLARIGMGARALKERAINYLEASKDIGSVAERAAANAAKNEDLERRNADLEKQVRLLAQQVQSLAANSNFGGPTNHQRQAQSDTISADDLGLGDKL